MSAEHSINLKGLDIPYSLNYGRVKTPRLKYSSGKLVVSVPQNFKKSEELLHKHKLWIYRRHVEYTNAIHESSSKELLNRSEEEFKEIVMYHVKNISDELGVMPEKVTFRKMKTKWGSCSSKKRVNLNRHLMHLPGTLIEYVVFHEMAHLVELNHSPHFWNVIDSRYADRKEYDRQLSAYWYLIQKTN
ncbi:M48 family metallopeptidase [Methanococcoides sp. SA1]|nr:M48 family metallopeptidase [Methanococcoides sp. SA1]